MRDADYIQLHGIDLRASENRQRGSSAHILLAVIGVLCGATAFLASEIGVLNVRSSELVAIVLGAMLLPLIFMDPIHLLLVVLLIAPISPEREIMGLSIRYQDFLIPLLALGCLYGYLSHRRDRLKLRGLWPVWLYLGYATFSTLLGYLLASGGHQPDVMYLLKAIELGLLTICTAFAIQRRENLRWVLLTIFAATLIMVAQLDFSVSVGGRLDGSIFGEQANVLSVYLVLVLCLLLGFLDRAREPLTFIVLVLLCGVVAYAILATKSRTGLSGLAVTSLAGIFLMRRRLFLIAGLIAGSIALLTRVDLLERAAGLGAPIGYTYDASYQARLRAYDQILQRISSDPVTFVLGEGRGVETLSWADTQWGIELLYGGMIGLLVFIVLAVAVLFYALGLWKRTGKDHSIIGAVATGTAMAVIASVVTCFGLTSWSAIRCGELIFVVLGIAVATDRIYRTERALSQVEQDDSHPWSRRQKTRSLSDT